MRRLCTLSKLQVPQLSHEFVGQVQAVYSRERARTLKLIINSF